MLRDDERAAWDAFVVAEPYFANEAVTSVGDGPDPPDVLCVTASNRRVGVELTKWLDHEQIESGKAQEYLEKRYLGALASEKEPRPDHIGFVYLYPKPHRLRTADQMSFRSELLSLLNSESAKNQPDWENPQGGPIRDFSAYPTIARHLDALWIHPRRSRKNLLVGEAWIQFEEPGGAFTAKSMLEAALDRIFGKIDDYENRKLLSLHSLDELHLLCYYSDETLLYNSPADEPGFDFATLASRVANLLAEDHGVFKKIFLFNPYEKRQVMQVYPSNIAASHTA